MSIERVILATFAALFALSLLAMSLEFYLRLTEARLEACGRNPYMTFCEGWSEVR